MCVCVCVRSNLPPHTLESQERYDTNGLITIQEQFKKGDFCKNVSFKTYGVICYLEQLRHPRAAFFHEISCTDNGPVEDSV